MWRETDVIGISMMRLHNCIEGKWKVSPQNDCTGVVDGLADQHTAEAQAKKEMVGRGGGVIACESHTICNPCVFELTVDSFIRAQVFTLSIRETHYDPIQP
jgi:hypothetical protein